mmetsp:Transcript_98755/g.195790  ORF Transcript_98755/g.195790 Transcript_98755/m.195790 type:complete len:134 (+) Transcript_98755:137-538(+)|eukprot:CAMPEP_0172728250 /NCGR_PEP_ID=MMETSP1074-20121228/92136_1 /TAXON_ID=2916 /ORGANISM="Ceratium fusus, Strain PA161109" /LENGTH=133 /DNA_ID=CAMNT_0013555475 /DNA_START=107 /DNA_END=508 /DNA_ORIENTATION=+
MADAKLAASITTLVIGLIHFVFAILAADPQNFEMKKALPYESAEFDTAMVKKRIYANQAESIPIQMLAIFWGILNAPDVTWLAYLVYAYCGFRVFFVVLYLLKVQPFRSLCFAGSWLMTIIIAVTGCTQFKAF